MASRGGTVRTPPRTQVAMQAAHIGLVLTAGVSRLISSSTSFHTAGTALLSTFPISPSHMCSPQWRPTPMPRRLAVALQQEFLSTEPSPQSQISASFHFRKRSKEKFKSTFMASQLEIFPFVIVKNLEYLDSFKGLLCLFYVISWFFGSPVG